MENELQKAGTMDLSTELFDGNSGFEGVDNECVQTPYLKLAQDSTDERKKQSPKYIQGLEAGQFFCPSSRSVYGESFLAVVLRFYRAISVYQGEGPDSKFKGVMDVETFKRTVEPFGDRVKSYIMHDGLRYVDTRNFIVVPYDHMEDGPMLFSLSSTGISPSRKWVSQAMSVKAKKEGKIVQAPIWASVWKLNVAFYDGPNGSYYQLSNCERMGWVDKEYAPAFKSMFDDAQRMVVVAPAETEHDEPPMENVSPETLAKEAADPTDKVMDPTDKVKSVFGGAKKDDGLF